MGKRRKVRLHRRRGTLVPVECLTAKEIANSFAIRLYRESHDRDRDRGSKYYGTIIKIPMNRFDRICEHPHNTKVQRKILKRGRKLDVVIGFGKNVVHVGHDI